MPLSIKRKNLVKLETRPSVRISPKISLKIDTPSDFLPSLATSIDTTPQNFSFKSLQLDNESIKNPNIIELGKFEKNKKLNVNDKFSEIDDPFYDFDEKRENISMSDNQKLLKISKKIKPINLKNNTGKRYE